jgi:hypothetical protein
MTQNRLRAGLPGGARDPLLRAIGAALPPPHPSDREPQEEGARVHLHQRQYADSAPGMTPLAYSLY